MEMVTLNKSNSYSTLVVRMRVDEDSELGKVETGMASTHNIMDHDGICLESEPIIFLEINSIVITLTEGDEIYQGVRK